MRPHIDLADFLRTGLWGPLGVPTTRDAVRDAFGAPDHWLSEPADQAAVWRYGVLELHFADAQRCFMIYTDHIELLATEATAAFSVAPWLVDHLHGATIPQVTHRLSQAGISVQQKSQEILVTPAGVCLDFRDGEGLGAIYAQNWG